MINYLIVSHGPLAEAFKESLRMFFGEDVEKVDTIGIYPQDAIDTLKENIITSIKRNYTADGIMIFVDIYAGSPFNMTALSLHELKNEYPRIECFAGANLAILMEALAGWDSMTLEEISAQIEEKAPSSFVNVKKALEL